MWKIQRLPVINFPIQGSEVLFSYYFLPCVFPSPHYALMPWDLHYWISSLRGICYSLLAEPIINKKEKPTKKQMNVIPSHSVQCTWCTSSYSCLISGNNITMEKKHCLTHSAFKKCLLVNSSPRCLLHKHSHKLKKSYSEQKQIKCAS